MPKLLSKTDRRREREREKRTLVGDKEGGREVADTRRMKTQVH